MATIPELKPCAFCGGEASICRYTLVDAATTPDAEEIATYYSGQWWHVVCTWCEVVLNNGWRTEAEAAAAWNKRAATEGGA